MVMDNDDGVSQWTRRPVRRSSSKGKMPVGGSSEGRQAIMMSRMTQSDPRFSNTLKGHSGKFWRESSTPPNPVSLVSCGLSQGIPYLFII
jgi:hypothetical protein